MWMERGHSAPELETGAVSRRDLVRHALTVVLTVALAGCRDAAVDSRPKAVDSRTKGGASHSSRPRQTDARQTEAGRSDTRRAAGRSTPRRVAPSSPDSSPSEDRTRTRPPES